MGISVPFRIKGGLDVDGKVQFQVFDSAPSGVKADKLAVGSLGIAQDTGQWYRKTTIGAGPDKWAALTTSTDLIGVAPRWLEPVDAVETRAMTKAEAKAWLLQYGHVGGAEFYSTSQTRRILFTNITDESSTVYESCFYPQPFIHPISPEAMFELRVNLPTNADTSAGNAYTYTATINNPANATQTTCVISGNTITFNLKNNGSVPTATMREYIDALEAADTENKFYVYHPEYTPEDIAGITEIGQTSIFGTPVAMAATNFSGGGNGSSDSAPSNWELGTAGVDYLHIRGDEDGNWNDFLVQLTTWSGTDPLRIRSDVACALGYDTIANAQGDMNGDDIFDGVAVTSGMKVFLFGLINGRSNIYTVSGSSGNWTLTEDIDPLIGDSVHSLGGNTHPNAYWRHNGTTWVSSSAPPAAMDGNTATTAILNETKKTLTIHLGNNGSAITATIGDVRTALGSPLYSEVYNAPYNDDVFYVYYDSMDDATVITATDAALGTGGVGFQWGFQPAQVRNIKGNQSLRHKGDTVFALEGFNAGSTWIFTENNTWVKQGASSTQEMGLVQTFIGKSGNGAEMPSYSSTDVVTQGADLEAAIGDLDEEAGDTLAFIGKSEGAEMPTYTTTNAVTQNASLESGISQLDLEVGYLLTFLGKAKGNEAPAYTTTKVVGQGTSLETAVSALDDLLGAAKKEVKVANVTTQVVADSLLMEQELAAEWIIHVREVANPGNVYVSRVLAAHNADVGVAATEADFTESAILELGNPITGFSIEMDVETSGALNARTMRLLMTSSDAVDVTMTREVLRRVE